MISSDPVPAVIESEATGEIKEIFDDIKNVTGVDVVNLVSVSYTHLTLPTKRIV